MDVETETSRDWAKDVDTETPSRLSLISGMHSHFRVKPPTTVGLRLRWGFDNFMVTILRMVNGDYPTITPCLDDLVL